jgi:DNA polymerase-1
MDYRELSKLQSTYLEALPQLINAKTGRVHTNFNQTITATGRLSSTNPNLQNIPVRTELGAMVRNAFIAPKGYKILSADYSQIELRLAAIYSGDKNLIKIFKEGKDIHTATAAIIHGIPESEVTKLIRSTAKEVNFGIIYGLGSVGLAQRTGMSRDEAKKFIETYFEKFPGIKKFITEAVEKAREKGYAETLFGRKRYLPDLISNNGMMRSAAERVAVNMPLQGTQADLIKLAMIKIYQGLPKVSQKTKMILQIHDQLLFEVPDDELEKVSVYVKETMEKANDYVVPITVDISMGKSWGELE